MINIIYHYIPTQSGWWCHVPVLKNYIYMIYR